MLEIIALLLFLILLKLCGVNLTYLFFIIISLFIILIIFATITVIIEKIINCFNNENSSRYENKSLEISRENLLKNIEDIKVNLKGFYNKLKKIGIKKISKNFLINIKDLIINITLFISKIICNVIILVLFFISAFSCILMMSLFITKYKIINIRSVGMFLIVLLITLMTYFPAKKIYISYKKNMLK